MRPRWKALPEGTDPRIIRFVAELRGLKDHHGLDMAALAKRTGYSTSSWDRYLHGRSPAPAAAVEALARLTGTAPEPLLVLRELAVEAYESTATAEDRPDRYTATDTDPDADRGTDTGTGSAPSTAPVPGTAPAPDGDLAADGGTADGTVGGAADGGVTGGAVRPVVVTGPNPWLVAALSSTLTALLTLGTLFLIAPWEREETPAAAPAAPAPAAPADIHPRLGEFVFTAGRVRACDVRREPDGRLYAGYSRTHTELIEKYSTRWSVVEAQCLLDHHGVEPGPADGAFGSGTQRAVERIQDRGRIAVDGVVGPDTWKVLRR
ncbi:peptidoglycan-binding protein [Streptomyces sp. NPDC020875]|uniref:peptidoglycan-binding protein n=1 Tax=Streptomyces sp. NPDC020875 TaxID=3154898 RepID=UPI003402A184